MMTLEKAKVRNIEQGSLNGFLVNIRKVTSEETIIYKVTDAVSGKQVSGLICTIYTAQTNLQGKREKPSISFGALAVGDNPEYVQLYIRLLNLATSCFAELHKEEEQSK